MILDIACEKSLPHPARFLLTHGNPRESPTPLKFVKTSLQQYYCSPIFSCWVLIYYHTEDSLHKLIFSKNHNSIKAKLIQHYTTR